MQQRCRHQQKLAGNVEVQSLHRIDNGEVLCGDFSDREVQELKRSVLQARRLRALESAAEKLQEQVGHDVLDVDDVARAPRDLDDFDVDGFDSLADLLWSMTPPGEREP